MTDMVSFDTMTKRQRKGTMTELLREALNEVESIRAVARATKLSHPSLVRFRNGDRSLRLDIAERLAEHFGIECRRTGKRER